MRIYKIRLQGYRVFEDLLELELPSGLVGVYGANGAGKSYLVESIPWTLYGKTRTSVSDIRTSGTDKECFTEVEFEHEDHLYRVNRAVSAKGLVKARVWLDNELVADGVKETNRFVHSTLGMDVDSFRASVFAEQKQISSFSDASPAERQKLVLSLLGITPLDRARDLARSDGRMQLEHLKLARASLPDVSKLIAERDEILVEIRSATDRLTAMSANAELWNDRVVADEAELRRLEVLKAKSDQIIAVGKEKRRLFEELSAQVGRIKHLDKRLIEIDARLAHSERVEPMISALEARIASLRGSLENASRLEKVSRELFSIMQQVGCKSLSQLEHSADENAKRLDVNERQCGKLEILVRNLELHIAAIKANSESTRAGIACMAELGAQSNCPTCGQALGEGFSLHLEEERKTLSGQLASLGAKEAELATLQSRLDSSQILRGKLIQRRALMDTALAMASAFRLLEEEAQAEASMEGVGGSLESAILAMKEAKVLQSERLQLLAEKRQIESLLAEGSETFKRFDEVEAELNLLKAELRELGFDYNLYLHQAEKVERSRTEARRANDLADKERIAGVQVAGRLERVEALIAQARDAQDMVNQLESRSQVLNRVADFLSEFRSSTIAALGPRLAASSASLFSELTEGEYDQLEVDTSTWQLRISDFGCSYDLGRFSGSERDLANLAFRIAISEQIGYSFGQQIGLLVLDEIFGPLDDQRRFVILGALDNLKARFNQVIVVTHGVEIKEQMPGAIEVVKLGRRRATARVA